MDNIQFLIDRQRLLVKANILNSFDISSDEFEKAPGHTTVEPLHKYTSIHISKNGNKVYDYKDELKIKRVNGVIDYPKKKDNGKRMEVTVDKEGRSIRQYSSKEIEQTKNLLSTTFNIANEKIKCRKAASTSTLYMKFRHNNRRFDIRLADHTYKIPEDEDKVLLNCLYKKNGFIIEASIYNYTPTDIVDCVQALDNSLLYFNSDKTIKAVQKYVEDNYEQVGKDNYDDYILYPQNIAMELAGLYMKENNISDDKYNSKFHALRSIMEDELAKLDDDI